MMTTLMEALPLVAALLPIGLFALLLVHMARTLDTAALAELTHADGAPALAWQPIER